MNLERHLGIALFVAAGCNDPSPLSAEEEKHIERMLDYGAVETTFVDVLSTYAHERLLFDAEGKKGVSAFQREITEAESLLDCFSANNQIHVYDPEEMKSKDHFFGFYHDPLIGEEIIAINVTLLDRGYVDPYILYHEASHAAYGSHDRDLQEEAEMLITEENLFSVSFAEKVIAKEDFPYLISFFYHAADVCYKDPVDYIERVLLSYKGSVSDGTYTPQEAYDDLTLLIDDAKEEWARELTSEKYPALSYLELFGVRENEMEKALLFSELFEAQQEIYKEGIDRFVASYPDEEISTLEEEAK